MSLKLTVITDTHYYSPLTGTSGSAYESALMRSQKLLGGSRELLQAAFDKIVADKSSDIVLIAGDVTNDGEEAAHSEFREMLRDLKAKGKKVYVITATHDYKEKCKKYVGDKIEEMPGLLREELFDFYHEFGADEAISCKPEYMSYIVQLPDNVRLFALNDDRGIEGEFLDWVREQAEDARKNGQFIIAMTHHPIIPPSPMYELIGKGDMHRNYKDIRKEYADMGIQLMLTGHTHTHNIGRIFSERGNAFYAVSTGALIGYPAPTRKLTIEDNFVKVETEKVEKADIDTNSLT
ncbi:MAG: metallophosphoesterase, partial [Acutalibacteraceae bacterium]|nr:metallophosphoesterase [Acutalibacteraceae bacterium]